MDRRRRPLRPEGLTHDGAARSVDRVDVSAYQSLRQRPVTRAERYVLGKSLRKRAHPDHRRLDDLWLHGPSDRVDLALCTFARRYADQTEADHAAMVAAVDRGMLPVERGV